MRVLPLLLALVATAPAPKQYVPWTLYPAGNKGFALETTAPGPAGGHGAIALRTTRPLAANDLASAYEVFDAKPFRGHRLRIVTQANAPRVANIAVVFARAVSEDDDLGGLAGMRSSLVAGAGWHPCDVVLDVPPMAVALVLGMALRGGGELAIVPPHFELVGRDVPLSRPVVSGDAPNDLDFEPPTDPDEQP